MQRICRSQRSGEGRGGAGDREGAPPRRALRELGPLSQRQRHGRGAASPHHHAAGGRRPGQACVSTAPASSSHRCHGRAGQWTAELSHTFRCMGWWCSRQQMADRCGRRHASATWALAFLPQPRTLRIPFRGGCVFPGECLGRRALAAPEPMPLTRTCTLARALCFHAVVPTRAALGARGPAPWASP